MVFTTFVQLEQRADRRLMREGNRMAQALARKPNPGTVTRGRKPTIDSARIVREAVALLAEDSLNGFTLNKLARRLGVSVMALYTYFPSRNALLDAAADHVFALFERPAARERWQDEVHDWLWAMQRHFERHPVGLDLLAWEDHVTAAWVRAWRPIADLLDRQDLKGARHSFAVDYFMHAAIATMFSYRATRGLRVSEALSSVVGLAPADQRFIDEYARRIRGIDSTQLLDFSFDQIVRGLEFIIAAPPCPDDRDDSAA